ncbi:MAG TPA: Maf family protein [Bryobacteraceae bacterium]|nr:Maf family protein [Bryobacteraceae bacterium]
MLVLASTSPRRQQILRDAGVAFVVRAPNVPEERRNGESPLEYVRRLAHEKACAVPRAPGEVVLAADTVVVLDEHVLEKPLDAPDARRMLALLSGRVHEVITGICLRSNTRIIVDVEVTRVHFVELAEEEMAAYVASGEPMDKAGAYAIQGLASKFIDRVEGCYFNVVGLPVALVYRRLKELEQ